VEIINTVEPIRDKKKIEEMKTYLKSKSLRDYTLFTLGINSGLRISDLLKLNVSDILDENGKVRDRIDVREKKTGKAKTFPFNTNAYNALAEYVASIDNTQITLFASQKGCSAITRQHAWVILNDAAKHVGIKDKIGTHTLRKSFGFALYEAGVDITRIQGLLNHSSPKETLRYIGITQTENDEIYLNLNL